MLRLILLGLVCLCPVRAEWIPLFDGRSWAGWVVEGKPGEFRSDGGAITMTAQAQYPSWIRTENEYQDFRLRFEYMQSEWAEAAILLRAPVHGRPARAGLAVALKDDVPPYFSAWSTGGIPWAADPRARSPRVYDTWRRAEISLIGDHLTVSIDGTAMQDIHLDSHPELRYRLRRGVIGFPATGYRMAVRNIQIEEVPSSPAYQPLLPQEGLSGWTRRGSSGSFERQDDVIIGKDGHGILYAPQEFQRFDFVSYVMSRTRANGGVFFLGSAQEPDPRGFEVQILNVPDSVYPTGSIYTIVRADSRADYEGRWFLLQVIVESGRTQVRIDGFPIAEAGPVPPELVVRPGRIGFQIHQDRGEIQWKAPRVRVLP